MQAIEEIHEFAVNGQFRQAVNQIDEYGAYDFFADYRDYLSEYLAGYIDDPFKWFSNLTEAYMRIKNR